MLNSGRKSVKESANTTGRGAWMTVIEFNRDSPFVGGRSQYFSTKQRELYGTWVEPTGKST
jgi:hypothetical protein